jgi:hypothetical protein
MPVGIKPGRGEFREESLNAWAGLLKDLFPSGTPTSAQWTAIRSIARQQRAKAHGRVGGRPRTGSMIRWKMAKLAVLRRGGASILLIQ